MRSGDAKWLLLSSSLCNQQGEYSPDVALPWAPALYSAQGGNVCPAILTQDNKPLHPNL